MQNRHGTYSEESIRKWNFQSYDVFELILKSELWLIKSISNAGEESTSTSFKGKPSSCFYRTNEC